MSPVPRVGGGPGTPCPQRAATMLSRLLREHQAKQSERKELQGEPHAQPAVFSPSGASPQPGAWFSSNGPDPGKGAGWGEEMTGALVGGSSVPCRRPRVPSAALASP